jgi:hypothetical protein
VRGKPQEASTRITTVPAEKEGTGETETSKGNKDILNGGRNEETRAIDIGSRTGGGAIKLCPSSWQEPNLIRSTHSV